MGAQAEVVAKAVALVECGLVVPCVSAPIKAKTSGLPKPAATAKKAAKKAAKTKDAAAPAALATPSVVTSDCQYLVRPLFQTKLTLRPLTL